MHVKHIQKAKIEQCYTIFKQRSRLGHGQGGPGCAAWVARLGQLGSGCAAWVTFLTKRAASRAAHQEEK